MAPKRKRKDVFLEKDPRDYGAICEKCPLKGRSTPVFGEGPTSAKFAIVGEGPGRWEEKMGRPFVGPSGEFLDALLSKLGMPRSLVYLDNSTACFPPNGDLNEFIKQEKKKAKAEERSFNHPVDCCRPRLFRALGIPKCKECNKWKAGPTELRCYCNKKTISIFAAEAGGRRIQGISVLGNAALKSLYGVEGIMKWRASPLDLENGNKVVLTQSAKLEDEK